MTRRSLADAFAFVLSGLASLPAAAQTPAPAPVVERAAEGTAEARGFDLLEREDPVAARDLFDELLASDSDNQRARVGLGRAWLMLGNGDRAMAGASTALQADPLDQDAMALWVRGAIRSRQFNQAVIRGERYRARVEAAGEPIGAPLLAALGSALFRVQRNDEAAAVYREVLVRDPLHAEAHLRLGSGLTAPREADVTPELVRAVEAQRGGDRERAIELLRSALRADPGHPVAHRLLGDALFQRTAEASMAAHDPSYAALQRLLPVPELDGVPVAEFVPAYPELSPERQAAVRRSLSLFSSRLAKLVMIQGRHDLLFELERTTDAPSRARLRGTRTFDGRVWDDVRGIGGMQAATGIEALDEARLLGFDTLAHEVAHQVHFYALPQLTRVKIRDLYKRAKREGKCLDFYAATNEAEYFGQGVEAFASLAKRPGGETTHGHTRFELLRTDPRLHDLIASVVDHDPLADAARRQAILHAAARVALRCGRLDDARTAVGMMAAGPLKDELVGALAF